MRPKAEPPAGLGCLYRNPDEPGRLGYRAPVPKKQIRRSKSAPAPSSSSHPYASTRPARKKPRFTSKIKTDTAKFRQRRKGATFCQRRGPAPVAAADDERSRLSYEAAAHLAAAHLGDGAARDRVRVPGRVDLSYVANLRRGDLVSAAAPGARVDHKSRRVARPGKRTTEGIWWTARDARRRANDPDGELRDLRARVRREEAAGAYAEPSARRSRGGNLAPSAGRLTMDVGRAWDRRSRLERRRGAVSFAPEERDFGGAPLTDHRKHAIEVRRAPPSSFLRANHRARQCCGHPADYRAVAPAVRYATRPYTSWEKALLRQMDIVTTITHVDSTFVNVRAIVEPPSEVTFQSPIKGNRLRDSVGVIDPETGLPTRAWGGEACRPEGEVAAAPGRRRNLMPAPAVEALALGPEFQVEDPVARHGAYSSLNPALRAPDDP